MGKVGKDLLRRLTLVFRTYSIVVVSGIFLGFSLATGTARKDSPQSFDAEPQPMSMAGIKMMVPVLAAYIAYSLGGKPALAPGFVLGYLASNPVPG